MREKPILFSGPMVAALLNTKPNAWPAEPIDESKAFKWMTRRVAKTIPPYSKPFYVDAVEGEYGLNNFDGDGNQLSQTGPYKTPYKVGDKLWVRETWGKYKTWNNVSYAYKADYIDLENELKAKNLIGRWKPSIHMPKEAARIWLEVMGVRVERLQEITYDDCLREGMWNCGTDVNTLAAFQDLWQNLNAKRGFGWSANPYVWVYELKRV